MADDLALTPRTRQLLLIAAELLVDEGREDLDQDDPHPWGLFDLYPRLVATQIKDWRRQALRSYDQLAADIRELGTPIPRCTADELALWLMLDRASAIEVDRDAWPTLWSTVIQQQASHDDFDWPSLREDLFEDTDFLMLYAPELDGVDDPNDEVSTNRWESANTCAHGTGSPMVHPLRRYKFLTVRTGPANRSSSRRATRSVGRSSRASGLAPRRQLLRIAV